MRRVFESVAAFSPGWGVAMTGAGEPRQLDAARVSTNFFGVLGVRPMLGRGFLAGESEKGQWNVAVLSHALWLSQFGGDSAVVGRVVDMDGQPYRIVGVMPASFEVFQANVDAWLPLQIDPASPFHTGATALAFGRLRRGATVAQATRELSALAPQMRAAFNYTDDYARGATVIDFHESLVGDARRSILVLYAAVAILGLIAVVNVGNLLLAHAAGRRREMAVRRALGAAKSAIVRQMLVQSLVVGGGGRSHRRRASVSPERKRCARSSRRRCRARARFTWTWRSSRSRRSRRSPRESPSASGPRSSRRASIRTACCARARCEAGGHRAARIRQSLVVVAGLARDGARRRSVADGRVALAPRSRGSGIRSESRRDDVDSAVERPGARRQTPRRTSRRSRVESPRCRTSSGSAPRSTCRSAASIGTATSSIESQPVAATSAHPRVVWRSVIGDYFGAMRIPLLRGRLFLPTDTRDAPAVVLINATMARRFWPDRNPIGERIKFGNGSRGDWATIVGVVGDVRSQSADTPAPLEVYRPNAQQRLVFMHYVIRARGNPLAAMARVRAAVRSLDQTVPIAQVRSLDEVASTPSTTRRMIARLLAAFAALGLFLGAVGIYGVVAYGVRRRTREMGIRAALGAVEGRLTTMVLGEGLRMSSLGIVIGVVAAAAATRPMRALLFGVATVDPLVYAAVALTLAGVAIVASLAPARRAARIDPVVALRSD